VLITAPVPRDLPPHREVKRSIESRNALVKRSIESRCAVAFAKRVLDRRKSLPRPWNACDSKGLCGYKHSREHVVDSRQCSGNQALVISVLQRKAWSTFCFWPRKTDCKRMCVYIYVCLYSCVTHTQDIHARANCHTLTNADTKSRLNTCGWHDWHLEIEILAREPHVEAKDCRALVEPLPRFCHAVWHRG